MLQTNFHKKNYLRKLFAFLQYRILDLDYIGKHQIFVKTLTWLLWEGALDAYKFCQAKNTHDLS